MPLEGAKTLTLVVSLALYWLTAYVVLEARDARIGRMVQVMSLFLVPVAVVLGLPLIGEEARSGTLLLELMKPVSRASYFTGRVLGRALFAGLLALVIAVGLFVIALRTGTPMYTGTRWLLYMKALGLVSVVMSLAALAPLSSSRFGHLAYWGGFAFLTWQLASLLQVWDPGWIGGPDVWRVMDMRSRSYKKNARAGGRCNQIVKDGHRFDVGPTLFLMPEVFAETYAALGEKMSNHLDLKRTDPTYTVRFDDGTSLALTSNIGDMQTQLEAIEPGSFGGFLRYLSEGQLHYRLSLEKFVGRNFHSYFDYFSLGNLPLLFKLRALVKHYANVGRYFKNPRLKAAFTFQNMYLGLSPYDAPATYSLLQYTELAEGIWFPMGGMYRIIETLTAIAGKNGARFIYNAPVERIEHDGKRATGIVLQDGRKLEADVIVVNADLPYAYRELLKDEGEARKLDQKKFTCSAIMFYWGVDKVYPQIKHHNVWLAGDYKASFDRIFNDNTLPDEPSFYVHAPARTDPAAAPAGQDTLMVLMPVGHLDPGRWIGLH